MLTFALLLLAAVLVLYPSLVWALRNSNSSTVQLSFTTITPAASTVTTTMKPCKPGFEYFEGACYQIKPSTVAPDKKSCFSNDATNPPSILANVNNASAIFRVQRYLDSKNVPGSYYVNLFFVPNSNTYSISDGSALVSIPTGSAYLKPYIIGPTIAVPATFQGLMKYFGGQAIYMSIQFFEFNLLCEISY